VAAAPLGYGSAVRRADHDNGFGGDLVDRRQVR